jgi:hypothetical protein
MAWSKLAKCVFSFAVITLLAACMAHPISEGKVFIGDRAIKLAELKESDLREFLSDDWGKFDKHATDAPDIFTHKVRHIDWYLAITPPLPTYWPPRKLRSVTYYVYAEYQVLYMHGPALSRSAPWAKVVLNEEMPASKVILSTVIGPVVHGEGSVPISKQLANREVQIIKDGESHLSNFVNWTAIPDDEAEIKAIREYYCQWALTNHTADLVKDNHRAFFEWLSCPPRTIIPVLP